MERLVYNYTGEQAQDDPPVDESIGLIFRWVAQLSSHFGTEKAILAIIPAINEVIVHHNSVGITKIAYIAQPAHWTEWQYRFSLTLCPGRKYAEVTPDILKSLEFHTHRETL